MTHPEKHRRRVEMAAYVKGGKSVAQTARRFKVTAITVRVACRENGVPFGRFGTARAETLLKIVSRLSVNSGAMARIAAEVYVSPQYVTQVALRCVALKVPINPRYR